MARKLDKAPKDFGICAVACAPIRIKPDDTMEMVSQLLFGETIKILQKKGKNWIKIECTNDGYIGWMDPKMLLLITEKQFIKCKQGLAYSVDLVSYLINGDVNTPVLLGTTLPAFDGMSLQMPESKLIFNGSAINPEVQKPSTEMMVKIAKKYLNAPYLWGGRSPFGIDCSGFTQVLFKIWGFALPRDAYQQANLGELIDFVELAQEGDLAFFDNAEGKITHVGMVLANQEIIHASGRVRIDKLDHEGIFNKQTKKYTHHLKFIKRIS
ncbi:MAG TPA: C40 family peptidase [Saprospiraceae bacterium]|nr:C40 family peptidase [Saprospiraceae bacterium]HPN70683.1 C40 family peptidase [Saprospiraceae bacterium]